MTRGRPQQIDHPGYGPSDAFYRATGKANASDLQQLGRRPAAARRGQDQPLAAVRPLELMWRYRSQNWLRLL